MRCRITPAGLASVVASVVASLGGGGLIVLGLSSWLGKVWAQRLMQSESAAHNRELEDLKARALRSLEQDKALYQNELEALKATLNRDNDRVSQTFGEKLNLYKQAFEPVLELVVHLQWDQAALTPEFLKAFEKKRLVATVMLGTFAAPSAFEAYNIVMDYMFDCLELKQQFAFEDFRLYGFSYLNAVRRDIGVAGDDLAYRGTR